MTERNVGVIGWLDRPSGHYRDYAYRFLSVLREIPDAKVSFYITTSSFSRGDFDGLLDDMQFLPILEEHRSLRRSIPCYDRIRSRHLLLRRAICICKTLKAQNENCIPVFLAINVPVAYGMSKLGILPKNAIFVIHNVGRAERKKKSLKNWIYANMINHIVGYSKAIIVLEPCVKRAMARFVPTDLMDKVFVVPDPRLFDGLDCSNTCMHLVHGRAKRFLLIGSLTPSKGIELTIRAFEQVLKIVPDAKLVLAGRPCSEQYGKSIENLCRKLPSDSYELVLRQLSHTEYCEQIKNADFGLLPYENDVGSRSSGVLWDMLNMGKYVIMSSIPGFLDVHTDYGVGVVFETGNSASLAAAIISIVTSTGWVANHDASLERLQESYSYNTASWMLNRALEFDG